MTGGPSAQVAAWTADRLFDGGGLRRGLAVVVRDGTVVGLTPRLQLAPSLPLHDLGAGILAPGLVDIQVNGGGGVLFNAEPTAAGALAIAAAHRRFGTAALLPTVITDAAAVPEAAIAAIIAARREHNGAGILGIHVEGPFLDEARKGAHPGEHIRVPEEADVARLCALARAGDAGRVLVTLAPNIVPPETIRRLADAGVVVSLGHSGATAAEANAALAAGARCFTHLFNAMSQLGHRAPGMTGAALAASNAWASLIADGHHVDPVAAQVALRAKGERLILISDAMPTAAGGPDTFDLQGRTVQRDGTRLTLADGTLAGATITLADAVVYTHQELGAPLAAALAMATSSPAALLGLPDAGHIAPGTPANTLIHLADDLRLLNAFPFGPSAMAIA